MNQVDIPIESTKTSSTRAASPVGNDPWYVLSNLVIKDFKVRYRNMSLGIFWSLVNPLIMIGVLTYVFTFVFENDRPHFALFLLIGLLPYNFFSLAWSTGTESVVLNGPLIKRVPFQRELVPISVVLGNAIHYLLQITLLLVAVGFLLGVNAQWLWLPIIITLQVAFVCGISLITSALNVYYRDIQYLVQAINMVFFWIVPIFYGFDQVDSSVSWLYEINPVAAVILIMRRVLLYQIDPGLALIKVAAITVLTLWAGYAVFRRMQKDFSDYL